MGNTRAESTSALVALLMRATQGVRRRTVPGPGFVRVIASGTSWLELVTWWTESGRAKALALSTLS